MFIFVDALLADLQNTVPGQNSASQNGAVQNGTPGYGCLKGARRKEPQVSDVLAIFDIMSKPKLPSKFMNPYLICEV